MISNRKGQSTVELALVLPILLLLLVGIMEFGLIFKTNIQLQYGANELARAISLDATPSEVDTMRTSVFTSLTMNRLQVVTSPTAPEKGQPLTVTVTYQYQLITPLIGNIIGNNIILTERSVIIKE